MSVRSAREACAALTGGADIIDVKDPSQGALGRASLATLVDVVERAQGRAPVTAAWGELPAATPLACDELASLKGVGLIKLGTAGTPTLTSCRSRWQSFSRSLPSSLPLALVHYADWQTCQALDFAGSLALARQTGCVAIVFDTYCKQGGNLFFHYAPLRLQRMIAELRRRGLRAVIAGSLRIHHLRAALECWPDVIAVRGAACLESDREGLVCQHAVASLRAAIAEVHASIAQRNGMSLLSPPAAGR